ncbi:ATP-binding cassette domain-containing protein, partial [Kosakonia sp. H7A]|uniref:ATP-binding cassette domain-containing protein n=1 Tax=Kosakonia sp. H7A TaxID=2054598 RepID=UPI00272B442A
MDPIVSIQGLNKTYAGGFQALRGVDLQIRRGEIFALLGPNGAGKTTLLRVLAGLLRADAGKIEIDGRPARRVDRSRFIAYLGHLPAL